jgi:glucan 1,3-beta-glucosidase
MPQPLRGVNLGNWLLLEKWMLPELFESTSAIDEYSLCLALGNDAEKTIRKHRETYIEKEDFAWIKRHGLNAVRIPFGYWIIEPEAPYIGSIDLLDQALTWCDEFSLKAILDLHAAPGYQGPEHHCGRSGFFRWDKEKTYRNRTLDLLEQIAARYSGNSCVASISLLNEPDPSISAKILNEFNTEAIERIRKYMPEDRVSITIAAFTERRLHEFHGVLPAKNLLTDLHLYYAFSDFSGWSIADILAHPLKQQNEMLKPFVGPNKSGIIVGEWSMAIRNQIRPALDAISPWQRQIFMRAFGFNQLVCFDNLAGWFFWSYKCKSAAWSFRDSVEHEWLPSSYGEE